MENYLIYVIQDLLKKVDYKILEECEHLRKIFQKLSSTHVIMY